MRSATNEPPQNPAQHVTLSLDTQQGKAERACYTKYSGGNKLSNTRPLARLAGGWWLWDMKTWCNELERIANFGFPQKTQIRLVNTTTNHDFWWKHENFSRSLRSFWVERLMVSPQKNMRFIYDFFKLLKKIRSASSARNRHRRVWEVRPAIPSRNSSPDCHPKPIANPNSIPNRIVNRFSYLFLYMHPGVA